MSTPTNDGGPAFPVPPETDYAAPIHGTSLRDYFAAKAMQGLLANAYLSKLYGTVPKDIAANAYDFADAMIAVRNQTAK